MGSILDFKQDPSDENEVEQQVMVTHVHYKNELIDFEILSNGKTLQNIPETNFKQSTFQLYVEGKNCFLDVLNISGIKSRESESNDIIEVCNVLGIEAATETIVRELNKVYTSHGLHVDKRHLMLIGDLMTYTGKVLGFTRHGMMGKEDKSILTMASYEETVKHLFTAALQGETTQIQGVSDSIIVGRPIPIGTGTCSVLRDVDRKSLYEEDESVLPHREPLLLGGCPLRAMSNNDIIVTQSSNIL